MEDHREAYFFWRDLGFKGATSVHVDAHLDVCAFHLPGYAGIRQPEVHCGNYLLPAMAEGIVSTLVWVVPDHLPGSDLLAFVRREVSAWLHPTLSEYHSWQAREGRVEGRLRGCCFVVCRSDALPALEGPVLLDIDVDYYLGPRDEVWQAPEELATHLAALRPAALTVAYSVEGGYTPHTLRWLGPRTLEAWGQPPPPELPYRLSPLDEACFHLQRERYPEFLACLEQTEDRRAAEYLRAFAHFSQERFEDALHGWSELLADETDEGTRLHLLEMQGRTLSALGRHAEAARSFRPAASDAGLTFELARALMRAGQFQEAARSYRRGLTLGPELVIALEAQLELVQLYGQLGQPALAQAQKKRLLAQRLPPALQVQVLGLGLKAALAGRPKEELA